MAEPKKRFENYAPTPAQAKRIDEVNNAFKFLYTILQGLRPTEQGQVYATKYLNQAVDSLEDAWIKSKMSVIYNDTIKEETEK